MTRIVHILPSAMTVLSASLCGIALWFWMQGQWVIDYDLWNSSWSLEMRSQDPTDFQIDLVVRDHPDSHPPGDPPLPGSIS
jgi:hypothetical protein